MLLLTEFHPLRPVWSLISCVQLHKSMEVFGFVLKTEITYCLPASFFPLGTLVLKKNPNKTKPQLEIMLEWHLIPNPTSPEVIMPHPTSPKIIVVTQVHPAYGSYCCFQLVV